MGNLRFGLLVWFDSHGSGSASFYLYQKNGNEIGDGVNPLRSMTGSLKVDLQHPIPSAEPLKAIGKVEEIHLKNIDSTWRYLQETTLLLLGK